MMSLCTDGALVTMTRRFDDERMRLAGELVAEQAKLEHLALHDPLTGLANRALFKQNLEEALSDAGAPGARVAVRGPRRLQVRERHARTRRGGPAA